MHVGGHVLVEGPGPADAQVSRLVPIWGWATWRRAWALYDSDMTAISKLRSLPLRRWFGWQRSNVIRVIEKVHRQQLNVWGARWAFTVMANEGLSILPRVNLISNIGFGDGATNTDVETDAARVPVSSLPLTITLPTTLVPSPRYDEAYLSIVNQLGPRIKRVMTRWIKKLDLASA
jgi:hypothetical protein